MFIDESDSLYVGMDDCGMDVYHNPVFEIFGENFAFGYGCGNVPETLHSVGQDFILGKTPKIVVHQAIFLWDP